MRRASGFSSKETYERIYENMRTEMKRYVRYNAAEGIDELQMRITEQEEIEKLCRQEKKAERTKNAKPNVATTYSKEECCWRCKQRGHTRRTCKRPPRKFCSQCGRDDVLIKECHPAPGNAKRAGGQIQCPELRIKYDPRPHTRIKIGSTRFRKLIDTGAEISFINEKTAQQLQRYGHKIQAHDGEIQIANGESVPIPGTITVPVRIERKILQHKFAILLTLESPVLMEVDLWARKTIRLKPSRTNQRRGNTPLCTV
ncbi:uncharacterized protein LOC126854572 [Cataglyphis hispanica]|uniref:uncharacterized protein LOC126854572 n=1 Tax=Cataglyphis hispanica TaxID=1086592 RepID=UPI00217F4B7E|nr:uncharacterized protein LOC126854572 [Cataglyphis hispanica]